MIIIIFIVFVSADIVMKARAIEIFPLKLMVKVRCDLFAAISDTNYSAVTVMAWRCADNDGFS